MQRSDGAPPAPSPSATDESRRRQPVAYKLFQKGDWLRVFEVPVALLKQPLRSTAAVLPVVSVTGDSIIFHQPSADVVEERPDTVLAALIT
jgi:hypothetical protein